jgi:NAD kinase
MGSRYDRKIVIVTRATQLASLQKKFSTRSRAKFEIVSAKKRELARAGAAAAVIDKMAEGAFQDVDSAAQVYDDTVLRIKADLDAANLQIPVQTIDRDFLPNFVFGPEDVIVTIGQDGLVANTAKYVLGLPIIAVNPDPARIDGVLLPFVPAQVRFAVQNVLRNNGKFHEVTLAQATLADGQTLLAFNELFIGRSNHTSARYRLSVDGRTEPQSSSGVLVCTGAGSTGWLSSVFKMASGVAAAFKQQPAEDVAVKLGWADPKLVFVVREPFVSRTSSANLIAGLVEPGKEIVIESEMASEGVIFSDGVESDYIEFNSGAIARIGAAPTRAKIVMPPA